MKHKYRMWTVARTTAPALGVLALAAIAIGAPARADALRAPRMPVHFSGLISDYTPTSFNGAPIKGSPYEMHGRWTLDLNETLKSARFSAAIAMETSEVANPDPDFDPAKLGAHTHHISVTDGVLHNDPTDWQTMCPVVAAVSGGFVVTGSAYVTANGANIPFGNPSPVTICILGGSNSQAPNSGHVEFANFILTVGAPANVHFGPQAIHGVVTACGGLWGNEQQECKVSVVQ